jgi:Tfp pilus assembly protein PilN
MIKVNLVPSDILAKAHQKQQVLQVAAAGVAALGVIALISAGHYYTLQRLEVTLAADQVKLKQLEVIVAQVEELERTAAALRSRLGVITDLLKGRTTYPYLMTDLARCVPSGVKVRGLTTQGGGSSIGPMKLTMTAEAVRNDDIADWLRRLEAFGDTKSPDGETRQPGKFSGVELGAVSAAGGLYTFSITATYTPSL